LAEVARRPVAPRRRGTFDLDEHRSRLPHLTALAPWLALVGLGVFHGLNPAMGWLFAVALGMNRQSEKVVWLSLLPIALGHALSVALVLAAFLGFAAMVHLAIVHAAAAALLIGWGVWQLTLGHGRAPRIGMRTGYVGLGLWSFLMASAHGAGLMLIPVLLAICTRGRGAHALVPGSAPLALAGVAAHSAAMLATIAAVAVSVYRWIGVAFLRRAWINLDRIWGAALIAAGLLLLVG
jgi:hypothetical protein